MRAKALVMLLGVVGVIACDDETHNFVPPIPNTLFGTFVLRTVNGRRIPTAILDSTFSPDTVVLQSGAITINGDNTFSDVVGFVETVNGLSVIRTVTCNGTYDRTATTFVFTELLVLPDCGRIFTGVVTGNTLSTSVRGIPAFYTTQPVVLP